MLYNISKIALHLLFLSHLAETNQLNKKKLSKLQLLKQL